MFLVVNNVGGYRTAPRGLSFHSASWCLRCGGLKGVHVLGVAPQVCVICGEAKHGG